LVVSNTEKLIGSQEFSKKKKKKEKQPDQLIVFILYLPLPVKLIDWSDDLLCLGMENQPIMVLQLINMMKVDHQSHDDDKEEYNAVADKGLFKSTN
jgi:hypothetical protein